MADLQVPPPPEWSSPASGARGATYRRGDRVHVSLAEGRELLATIETQQGPSSWLIRLDEHVDDETMSALQAMPGVRPFGYIPQMPPVPGRLSAAPQLWRDRWIVAESRLSSVAAS